MFKSCTSVFSPIHKEGFIFIIISFLITLILVPISLIAGYIAALLTIAIAYFFRDPVRVLPKNESLMLAPADGTVVAIDEVTPPSLFEEAPEKVTKISIFLSVFDVHVNRTPCQGIVKAMEYHEGKFLNASLDKSSVDNERQSILLSTPSSGEVMVVQIAGLVARRIVCDLSKEQKVAAGDKFGIIRFGSRVDVYFDPAHWNINVQMGQTMIGAETIIAQPVAAKTLNEIVGSSKANSKKTEDKASEIKETNKTAKSKKSSSKATDSNDETAK